MFSGGVVDGVAGQVIEQGPSWIDALSQLTPVVAIALLLVGIVVLYVYGQRREHKSNLETIEVIHRTIVSPMCEAQKGAIDDFKQVITNHLEHDAEDRREQTEAFRELVSCIKDKGGRG